MGTRARTAVVILSLVAITAITATSAAADGWRSHSRRNLERDDAPVIVDENCRQGQFDGRQHFDQHFDQRVVDQPPAGPATRPYWGTMRPYWGPTEPPGVIGRGLRTQDLKVRR